MSLNIKDADGVLKVVKTTEAASVHTPHHIVDSSALPTGAATSAKQDVLLAELQNKADLDETQPVSVQDSALPTGAATESTLASVQADTANVAGVSGVFTRPGYSGVVTGALATSVTDGTATSVIASQGANTRMCIATVTVSNSDASDGCWVNLLSASTVIGSVFAPSKSAQSITFAVPLMTATAEAFRIQTETPHAEIRVTATGYSIAV